MERSKESQPALPRARRLKEAFQQLAGERGEVDLSLEQLQALAEDRIVGDERTRLLLQVSASPGLLREYELLRQVAATRPKPAELRVRLYQIAAVFALAVSMALLGKSLLGPLLGPKPEPLRGSEAVTQLAPEPGAEAGAGSRLVWRPVSGAVGYMIELLAPDGRVAWTATGTDTTYTLPDPLPGGVQGAMRWWIAAELSDKSIVRSPTRELNLR